MGARPTGGPSPAALALGVVLLLALGAVLPASATAPGERPAPPPAAPPPAPAALAAPATPAAAPHPANSTGPPRNVLADVPCNGTQGNAEVVEAYDAAAGDLYESWIGCGGIGFSRSTDGGYSFSAAVAVPGSQSGSSWDPAIAVAPNGTVYVAYMLNNGSGDTPAVAWSWNHGQSFAGWQAAFAANTSEFSDRDYLTVAPNGTVYLTWDLSPNASLDQIGCASGGSCYFLKGDYNIVIVWSSDGGVSWSAPVPVEPEYPWAAAPAGPLLVEPNGSIDVLYEDYPTTGSAHILGVGRNYFVQSVDGGVNWSAPVAVENGTFANSTWWIDGSLARDASGTLYAGFDTQNATADTAFVSVSRDDGRSWSAPIRLNPDSNGAVHALVTVAGGPNGTAYVAWMANNSTQGWSVEAATLYHNGSTLTAPSLVSDQFGISNEWIGDTLGIADLGTGRIALGWSYGVTQAGFSAPQVFVAVLGATPPVDAPVFGSVSAGPGSVTLHWTPPVGAGDWVGGYLLIWGLDNQLNYYNRTFPASANGTTIGSLPPFLDWYFEIAATNGAGAGPFSAPIHVALSNWGVVTGAVTPASATVEVDGLGVPSAGGVYRVNTTAGPHVVWVSAPNYAPFASSVVVPWNGTSWLNATLAELPATVEGWVTPLDATVTWDGASVPTDPQGFYALANVTSGRHTLSVSRSGFETASRNLTVAANTTVWANVSLVPANGTLALVVSPASATVEVGAVAILLDARGFANVSLPPGRYAVHASASGYAPYFGNTTLTSLAHVPLTIALTALPPPPRANGSGTAAPGIPGTYLIVGAVVVVAAVVVGAFAVRRRRRGPSGDDAGTAEPLWEADEPNEEAEPTPDDAA